MVSGKIGFLHLEEKDCAAPVRALKEKIDGLCSKENTVIVLLEAFNFGADYMEHFRSPHEKRRLSMPFDGACSELMGLTDTYQLTFIAGLMRDQPDGKRRCSSAYVIEPHSAPRLICNKMTDDGSGEYDPLGIVPVNRPPWRNPVLLGNSFLGILICSDGLTEETSEYRKHILRRMSEHKDSHELFICYLTRGNFGIPKNPHVLKRDGLSHVYYGQSNAGNGHNSMIIRLAETSCECIDRRDDTGIVWYPKA